MSGDSLRMLSSMAGPSVAVPTTSYPRSVIKSLMVFNIKGWSSATKMRALSIVFRDYKFHGSAFVQLRGHLHNTIEISGALFKGFHTQRFKIVIFFRKIKAHTIVFEHHFDGGVFIGNIYF